MKSPMDYLLELNGAMCQLLIGRDGSSLLELVLAFIFKTRSKNSKKKSNF